MLASVNQLSKSETLKYIINYTNIDLWKKNNQRVITLSVLP